MGTDYVKQSVSGGFDTTATINQNFTDIETSLSRSLNIYGDTTSGTNAMQVNLDMNSQQAINAAYATSNAAYPTLAQVNALITGGLVQDVTSASVVNTKASLTALDVTDLADNHLAITKGYISVGDGGHGVYYYDSSSALTDNSGTILDPDSGSGQWLLIYDQINVRQFGATGDGTTDDATACQAAIDATTSRSGLGEVLRLHWPAGTYLINSNLALTVDGSDFNWTGDGPKRTIIKASTSAVTEIFSLPNSALGDTNFTSLSKIEGMTFDGNSVATYGIRGYANHFTIRDCRILRTTTAATDISYGWDMLYDNCEILSNTGDGLVVLGSGSNNDVTIRDCKITSNTGAGLMTGSSTSQVRVRGCAFEGNGECAIYLTNSINNIEITGCYFEANVTTGYTFTTPAETIKADIICNGSGQATLGYGTPIVNAVIENNYISSGGATSFVYAGGMNYGTIKNNTLSSGVSRLLTSYGNVSGSLTYGYWSNLDIAGNKGFAKTYTGTHDGSGNSATLDDSGAPFVASYLIGALVHNTTDSSSGIITANTTTQVTASLAGGTDDDWDASDAYTIFVPEVGVTHLPVAGTGTALDIGTEFANTKWDEAEKINVIEPDLNQWAVVSGSNGTWQRSATVFGDNPNVSVWDIVYASAGSSKRMGQTFDMSLYPELQGQFAIFSVGIKHAFSGDGNVQLYCNGVTDTASTNSTNTWQEYKALFRFPVDGTASIAVMKAGASGTVQIADPHVTVLGATLPKLADIYTERTSFKGTAAPTAGTWKDGDTVYDSAPAVGAPAAWTCTTAGAPGTWTAWANL